MQLAIYRSVAHSTYPDEMMAYLYAFQPIAAEELTRDGRLLSWTSDSGPEPYAVVEVPEGTLIRHADGIWQVQVPDMPFLIDADHIYEVALDCAFGLSVIRGPACDDELS
jgi:hypothetical protein